MSEALGDSTTTTTMRGGLNKTWVEPTSADWGPLLLLLLLHWLNTGRSTDPRNYYPHGWLKQYQFATLVPHKMASEQYAIISYDFSNSQPFVRHSSINSKLCFHPPSIVWYSSGWATVTMHRSSANTHKHRFPWLWWVARRIWIGSFPGRLPLFLPPTAQAVYYYYWWMNGDYIHYLPIDIDAASLVARVWEGGGKRNERWLCELIPL